MSSAEKMLVRLIDDDPMVLKAMKSVLVEEGFEVKTYLTAEDFLTEDANSILGCLVLDLRMPNINGLQLQKILKEREFHHPVIFLTAHGEVESAVLAMKMGAVDFLQKPVSPPKLVETIRKACKLDETEQWESQDKRIELLKKLSPREKDVIVKVLQGLSNREAGESLGISEKTIENHRNNAYRKLNVKSFKELQKKYSFHF